jgi:choline-glycine betaine transporter
MTDEIKTEHAQPQSTGDFLKSWVMVGLTVVFVSLYVAALFGTIEPLKDASIITRLEPILFVIIGYYFGRLPAQANENTLKNEINRQSQRADASQQIKEKAQQEREVLEEKIRNVRITLADGKANVLSARAKGIEAVDGGGNQAVETALKILDS